MCECEQFNMPSQRSINETHLTYSAIMRNSYAFSILLHIEIQTHTHTDKIVEGSACGIFSFYCLKTNKLHGK